MAKKTLKQLQAEQKRLQKQIAAAEQKEKATSRRNMRSSAAMVMGLLQMVMVERYRYEGENKIFDEAETLRNAKTFFRGALEDISHDRSIFKNLSPKQVTAINEFFGLNIEALIAEYEEGFTFEGWRAEKKALREAKAAKGTADIVAEQTPPEAPTQPSDGVVPTASDAALKVLKTLQWDADALYWKYITPDRSKMKHTGFTADQKMEMTEYIMRKY